MNRTKLQALIKKEGNFKTWEQNGFPCVIARPTRLLHLCGYVGLPKGHKYYGKDYDDIGLDVHGGFTFSSPKFGNVNEETKLPKGYWWLGFDCAHLGDLIPCYVVDPIYKALYPTTMNDTYRDMKFVKREINKLIKQL